MRNPTLHTYIVTQRDFDNSVTPTIALRKIGDRYFSIEGKAGTIVIGLDGRFVGVPQYIIPVGDIYIDFDGYCVTSHQYRNTMAMDCWKAMGF